MNIRAEDIVQQCKWDYVEALTYTVYRFIVCTQPLLSFSLVKLCRMQGMLVSRVVVKMQTWQLQIYLVRAFLMHGNGAGGQCYVV